jgi:hypothetical protein
MRRLQRIGIAAAAMSFGAIFTLASQAADPPTTAPSPAVESQAIPTSGSSVSASPTASASASPATQPSTQPAVARVKSVNKFCPVHPDNPVDDRVETVTYDGEIIGFCCPDCIPIFNADPEMYMANLK